jgi:hypothetical protein
MLCGTNVRCYSLQQVDMALAGVMAAARRRNTSGEVTRHQQQAFEAPAHEV